MARVHGAEMKRRSSHELSGLDGGGPQFAGLNGGNSGVSGANWASRGAWTLRLSLGDTAASHDPKKMTNGRCHRRTAWRILLTSLIISAWEDCAVACLVSIRDPRAGLVTSRQTFARSCHRGAPPWTRGVYVVSSPRAGEPPVRGVANAQAAAPARPGAHFGECLSGPP